MSVCNSAKHPLTLREMEVLSSDNAAMLLPLVSLRSIFDEPLLFAESVMPQDSIGLTIGDPLSVSGSRNCGAYKILPLMNFLLLGDSGNTRLNSSKQTNISTQ